MKYILIMLVLAGCSELINLSQTPYVGPPRPAPYVEYAGMAGKDPWGIVTNPTPYPVMVWVDCSERIKFQLPPKTAQPFYMIILSPSLGEGKCVVDFWVPVPIK